MWCARFTESQLETLKDLIRIQGEIGSELEAALEAMELARWDDLPEAELPWPQVSEQAERQGISEGKDIGSPPASTQPLLWDRDDTAP